jgi:hypothetical protein
MGSEQIELLDDVGRFKREDDPDIIWEKLTKRWR